ncbi:MULTISPECIES: hypothetical protein [Thermococcus]|uniref:Uncharacterized protein n=1 Tax=Thermococcus sibiricus (strain DSM 12597 / MM 739) TaxID=604354 RepID=C6A0K4_THESM|nr:MULTISPECIES: hypothetical protein [Thermococcus]ACS89149.1 hypothetical protein TSIB_0081 [Thermococcus sibiricus MM 739]
MDILESFEAYAIFIVMAKDESHAKILVKEYIKKETCRKHA